MANERFDGKIYPHGLRFAVSSRLSHRDDLVDQLEGLTRKVIATTCPDVLPTDPVLSVLVSATPSVLADQIAYFLNSDQSQVWFTLPKQMLGREPIDYNPGLWNAIACGTVCTLLARNFGQEPTADQYFKWNQLAQDASRQVLVPILKRYGYDVEYYLPERELTVTYTAPDYPKPRSGRFASILNGIKRLKLW